jgi:hypothetical protein
MKTIILAIKFVVGSYSPKDPPEALLLMWIFMMFAAAGLTAGAFVMFQIAKIIAQ